jgi:hypothetical protein
MRVAPRGYKLHDKLYDHPTHGLPMKRMLKEVDPTINIPEIDIAEPLVNKLQSQIDALKQERTDERDLTALKRDLDAAQKKHRLTDEGMDEVKRLMVERKIADPEAAALLVVSNIEPPNPVTGSNFAPADLKCWASTGERRRLGQVAPQ